MSSQMLGPPTSCPHTIIQHTPYRVLTVHLTRGPRFSVVEAFSVYPNRIM